MLGFFPKRVEPERTAPVLYVHPRSQMMLKEMIPVSVPALMNRLPAPVVGRFEDELTPEQVSAARIALMDVHWYLSLPAALRLADRLKRLNPQILNRNHRIELMHPDDHAKNGTNP